MRSPGNDTIAAVATPPGAGGIGIVRISGPAALAIAGGVFRGRGGRQLKESPPFKLELGAAVDPGTGEQIDEVLAVLMPEGKSFTGEPTVEIQAHGGTTVLDAILHAALASGARLAAPGEFTKRAFLSGRIDLSQAEAVAEIISAESDEDRRLALQHLQGGMAAQIGELRARLLDLVSGTEALLDFGDEEGAGAEPSPERLLALAADLRDLAASGRAVRQGKGGFNVAIAGRPNAGKSSLFNVLLDFKRSIVAPGPGTTRDYIEERVVIGGAVMTLVDTAGIRPSDDPVEAEGVVRSRRRTEDADLPIILIDSSVPASPDDLLLLEAVCGKSPFVVFSKADLPQRLDRNALQRSLAGVAVFEVSALTGAGVSCLITALANRCRSALPPGPCATAAPNARHQDALRRAAGALESAERLISGGQRVLDQAAYEFRSALSALDEITGESASDEVIDRIFSRFCVGK